MTQQTTAGQCPCCDAADSELILTALPPPAEGVWKMWCPSCRFHLLGRVGKPRLSPDKTRMLPGEFVAGLSG